ncbi:MAG TPA: hypothetical protein VFG76_02475 [Candidatus Polarisedimenticolia bacterium]|nr:hypothetical protein [Candidatus Polarisedimenticolia bacterium]
MRRGEICGALFCVMILATGAALAQGGQTQPAATQSQPAAVPAPAKTFDSSKSDEKAIAIADQVSNALGGDAWAKARFLKFTWVWKQGEKRVAITHYWDRFGQRSRMEGPTRDGKQVVAVVDHRTKQGLAMLDGQPQSGDDQTKYVKLANDRLINDAYWFFMQFKLKDPGVRLRYEGDLKAGPVTYDKVLVSFDDGVGLTSKDKYWIYVNRDTHKIERWSYVLEGSAANVSPVAWEWTDWVDVGGMKIASRKMQPGGESEISVENCQVIDSMPEEVFTTVTPVPPVTGS